MSDATDGTSLWDRLRRRKVVQWGIAYAAGAWGLLQGLEYVTDTFEWPGQVQRMATLGLLIGLPIVLVLAWYHGDRGQQRVTAAELTIITLLFLLGGGIFWRYERASETDASATAGARLATDTASPGSPTTVAEKSIAVLPFLNMSDSPDTEYFSDGLAEEILNALAQIPGLRVPSRTSSFAFRGRDVDLRSVASALQVAHVLEGSVRRDGQRIRVTAQLIDARTDSHLWSRTWDRGLQDVFDVQLEIAREIAGSLQVQFSGPDGGPRSVGTSNLAAYERYLQARHHWRERGEGPLRKSMALFEEAIRLDPGFARAHSGLAAASAVLVSWAGPDVAAGPLLNAAQTHAQRALSLDSSLAEAHAVLASVLEERWQFVAADAEYRRAIVLDASDSTAQQWYAEFLGRMGRFKDAEGYFARALELDPLSPIINFAAGLGALGARLDAAYAIGRARRAKQLGLDRAEELEVLAHVTLGDFRAARALVPVGSVQAALLDALIDPAKKPAALEALQAAPAGSRRVATALAAQLLPLVYLGEIDLAHVAAQRAVADRSLFATDMLAPDTSPNVATFRAHPRFQQLVRDAGLLEYWRTVAWPDVCKPQGDGVICDS